MPKLQNVTMDELRALEDRAFDLSADIHAVAEKLEKGYCDNIAKPVDLSRAFLSLNRSASELASNILVKAAMQELQRETEELLREKNRLLGKSNG